MKWHSQPILLPNVTNVQVQQEKQLNEKQTFDYYQSLVQFPGYCVQKLTN